MGQAWKYYISLPFALNWLELRLMVILNYNGVWHCNLGMSLESKENRICIFC